MPDHPAPGRRVPTSDEKLHAYDEKLPAFDEKLTVPWWWWPLGIGVAALLAAEVHLGYPGVRAWLPYLLTVPLTVAVLVHLGRRRIRICEGELQVGSAHIPLRHLGRIQVIPPAGKQRALGPDLDPAAFVLHRAWIGPLLHVELTDPQDPTPYWIFSARRGADLAEVLRTRTGPSGRDDVRQDRTGGHSSSR